MCNRYLFGRPPKSPALPPHLILVVNVAGISRERTPFVFTPDMLYVMGGKDSPHFERFQVLLPLWLSVSLLP